MTGVELLPPVRQQYSYLVFKRLLVLEVFEPANPEAKPDAYLSDDHETRALRAALDEGYRWVSTDGDFAVFEKVSVREAPSLFGNERRESSWKSSNAPNAVRPTLTLIPTRPTPATSAAASAAPRSGSKSDAAGLLEAMGNACAAHSLPEILRALAELCDWDAEQYTRDLDDSGIIGSCRRDAEALRKLAGEMDDRAGG